MASPRRNFLLGLRPDGVRSSFEGVFAMSDKFKVGQPVWEVSWSGIWRKGFVARERRHYTPPEAHLDWWYHVDVPGYYSEPNRPHGTIYSSLEQNLRPRDEGQFTPADESFEWRNKEVHA